MAILLLISGALFLFSYCLIKQSFFDFKEINECLEKEIEDKFYARHRKRWKGKDLYTIHKITQVVYVVGVLGIIFSSTVNILIILINI